MNYDIWIKNNTLANLTYSSQDILPGEYHKLKDSQKQVWAGLSNLLVDIASGDAIVAKIDDGNNDIVDVNEAINYLKGLLPQDVNIPASVGIRGVKEPKNMRARLAGIISDTVPNGTTKNLDWLMDNVSYNGQNKKCYFDGIQYYSSNANIGDCACFQVVDKDGFGVLAGWYDQATFDAMGNEYVVEQFGMDWYMLPNVKEDLMLYKSEIVPGLYIRVRYTSTGTEDVNVIVNLFRHLDSSKDA